MRPRSASERAGRHAQNVMGIRRRFTANSILIGALAKFVAVQCQLQPVMSTAAFLFHIQARLKRSHLSYKWSPKKHTKKQTVATKREYRAPRKSILVPFYFFPKFYFFRFHFPDFYTNFIRVRAAWCFPSRIYMFKIHKVYKGDRICNTTNHVMHGSHSKTAWFGVGKEFYNFLPIVSQKRPSFF